MTKFVAVEGIDGAGKQTFSDKIMADAEDRGLSAEVISFPRYGTPHVDGYIVPLLRGEAEVPDDPLYLSTLFALDRAGWQAGFWNRADRPDLVILDRFVASNIVYQCAVAEVDPITSELAGKLRAIESAMLAPDVTVLLPVSPEVALSRRRTRQTAEDDDRYEADAALQQRVWEGYSTLAEHDGWALTDNAKMVLDLAFPH